MKKEGDHFDVSMGAYKGVEVCELKETPKNVFKNNGLGVITYCNMKIVNYLDITYQPYQKADTIIQYILVKSNQIDLSQIPRRWKNVSPSSSLMKKYSMNYYPSMTIT